MFAEFNLFIRFIIHIIGIIIIIYFYFKIYFSNQKHLETLFYLCVAIMTLLMPTISANLFTSVQTMTQIFKFERRVVDALEIYVTEMEKQLQNLRK